MLWTIAGDLEVLVTPPVATPQEYGEVRRFIPARGPCGARFGVGINCMF
jgi:hypothetical protein